MFERRPRQRRSASRDSLSVGSAVTEFMPFPGSRTAARPAPTRTVAARRRTPERFRQESRADAILPCAATESSNGPRAARFGRGLHLFNPYRGRDAHCWTRERLTLIRIYEELRATTRFVAMRGAGASATTEAYIPLTFAPGEA
jgi:hypothetical protein